MKLPAGIMDHDIDASYCLDCLDLHEPMDRLRQFVLCRFSSFDLVADVTEGGHMHPEHTICDKRGRCPYEGILCTRVPAIVLSTRELEVVRLLPEDISYKMIADRLDITVNTVRTHIQNIQNKIGVHSNRAILQWAHEHQLIDDSLINNNSLWETEQKGGKSSEQPLSGMSAPSRTSYSKNYTPCL